ncbi:hypothetical protein QR680_010789 [Steinernema hermaphroditum]|uniref:Peptidase A1 domain-containing protein n=1 Tax=Steinernema hermaphroditum TaxID=289476 RepID=A0AA39IRB1_9BILA|nr:hypothetical protein QR680_010789 [Steinernema hermaphroditum]
MLKWFVVLALLLLCASFRIKLGGRDKPNIKVNARKYLPKKAQEAMYHHPAEDFGLLSTVVFVGRLVPIEAGFNLDTVSGDLEMHLCPSTNVTESMEPCYKYQYSPTYIPVDENTAMETFQGDNVDDKTMYNLTFVKSSYERGNNLGFGRAAMRKYPQDTFYPDAYFHQKPCLRRFRMSIARDGCEGGFTWGAICDEWMDYPTYMVPVTSDKYWQFAIYGFTLGNLTVYLNSDAVVASSRAYIGMPKKYLDILVKQVGAEWDDEYDAYTVWCFLNQPDFEVHLDNVKLKITPDLYIYTWQYLPNGKCVLNFEDSALYGFGPEWYFGLPLFASYCIGFDYDFGMLSFLYNDWVAGNTNCHAP